MISYAPGLPIDILLQILDRLEVLDLIRSGVVCSHWRSAFLMFVSSARTRKIKPQIPWLMFFSTWPASSEDSYYFYSLVERRLFRICVPPISGHHVVGSSEGFLITTDHNANLHVTNPLNASSRIGPLPPTAALPCLDAVRDCDGRITHYIGRRDSDGTEFEISAQDMQDGTEFEISAQDMQNEFYKKAIVGGGAAAGDHDNAVVAVIYGAIKWIAFARPGDTSWTVINPYASYVKFDDMIFHKGNLCVLGETGIIEIFDLGHRGSPPVLIDLLLTPLMRAPQPEPLRTNLVVVEPPDGHDFLIIGRPSKSRSKHPDNRFPYYRMFTVSRLDEVKGVGELAHFLGFNGSMSLRVQDFQDHLQDSCIYYTEDYNVYDTEAYRMNNKNGGEGITNLDEGVFDFRDGSIKQLDLANPQLQQFRPLPHVWFTPTLL